MPGNPSSLKAAGRTLYIQYKEGKEELHIKRGGGTGNWLSLPVWCWGGWGGVYQGALYQVGGSIR